jgi:MarR family transcriptional regulator, organic hydroperoxide resistance regulator
MGTSRSRGTSSPARPAAKASRTARKGARSAAANASGAPSAAVAEVVRQVRRLDRGLRLAAREVEASVGASAAQLFVLEQLAAVPAASIGELAERTMTDRSSVSTVVDRLTARGLVARKPSDADRRRAEVRVTAAGRALLVRAPKPPTARLIAAMMTLPAAEAEQFATMLTRLNDALGLDAAPAPLLFSDG